MIVKKQFKIGQQQIRSVTAGNCMYSVSLTIQKLIII